jgi:hypothetical protein
VGYELMILCFLGVNALVAEIACLLSSLLSLSMSPFASFDIPSHFILLSFVLRIAMSSFRIHTFRIDFFGYRSCRMNILDANGRFRGWEKHMRGWLD